MIKNHLMLKGVLKSGMSKLTTKISAAMLIHGSYNTSENLGYAEANRSPRDSISIYVYLCDGI